MEIVGHRGLPLKHVENTVGSFDDAFKNGADAIELDVHLTLDNVPIVFHDFDLKRLAGIDSKIYELTLSQIKKIYLGNDLIPTLEEVIKRFSNKKIYVELKTIDEKGKRYDDALPEILHKRFGEYYKNIVFISFDPKSISELRSYSEKYVLGLDYDENSELILPFPSMYNFLTENRIEYFLPDVKIIKKSINLLDSKFKIAPWTINDISIVENYMKYLSGIISDRCDIISKQIKDTTY
ncbi:MAG: glycerophosphodiester phosphodiesterase [Thermoplasmata archaeon]